MPRTRRKVGRFQLATRVLNRIRAHPANKDAPNRATARALGWQIRKRIGKNPVFVTAYGLSLEFPRSSGSLSNLFYFGECFEWQVIRFVRAYLRSGDNVMDVGANVGMFTYAAHQCVKPQGNVMAFEPSPWAAATIRHNVNSNNLDEFVHVYEMAAGASSGTAEFTADLDVSNHMKRLTGKTFSHDSISVQVEALDSLVPLDIQLALMKLDVEGAESLALEGFRRHLADGNPSVILIEAHDHSLRKMGSSRADVMATLREFGYRPWLYDDDSGELFEPPIGWNDDVIAVLTPAHSQVVARLADHRMEGAHTSVQDEADNPGTTAEGGRSDMNLP